VTDIYARLNTEAVRDAMESAQDAMFSGHWPQPAGTVRADAEVKTRAGCE